MQSPSVDSLYFATRLAPDAATLPGSVAATAKTETAPGGNCQALTRTSPEYGADRRGLRRARSAVSWG